MENPDHFRSRAAAYCQTGSISSSIVERNQLSSAEASRSKTKPTADGGIGTDGVISFGPFVVNRASRLIERNGEAVQLGSRAFDILACLLEHAGEVVKKAELLRQVWPNSVVEEGSLRFQINALRKALGGGRYIANVAGHGYSFVGPVSRPTGELSARVRPTSARPPPPCSCRLLGRDQVVGTLAKQVLEHRFVTVVGSGGVGKTSVALALAHDFAAQFDGDTCFFDVGSVSNPEFLAGGLASALGISMRPASAVPSITTFLQRRRMLLVLDGCEPEVDSAAALAEQIFRETPHVLILATSREALRVSDEHVYRLFPLDYPAPGAGQTAQEALGFAAVQLFVERAGPSLNGFALTDEDAPLVSTLCRKLDGLPLAIELVAGRVGAYGVREVARQLEGQCVLKWAARRTAVARHQTLSATSGWSYQLLSVREQLVFRRLSVFVGAFTLKMAAAMASDEEVSQTEAADLLGSLVSKSLVQFKIEGSYGSYKLLDITRRYAFDKLGEMGEVRAMTDRHSQMILNLLKGSCATQDEEEGRRRSKLLDDIGEEPLFNSTI